MAHRRPRLAQRHLRQPAPARVRPARRRRRVAGRQIQAHVPGAVMADDTATTTQAPGGASERPPKAMTIGAVCKAISQEFPDISISKIRYLEDQKLLTPRRTPGGYRLYNSTDVARLRTILRLQRDEFLPLRVIRQELASGAAAEEGVRTATAPSRPAGAGSSRGRAPRTAISVRDRGALYSLEDVLDETRAEPELVKELEEYGVIKGEVRAGAKYYDETDREIVRAVTELARYGVGGRNLRSFRTSADREAALLQQI